MGSDETKCIETAVSLVLECVDPVWKERFLKEPVEPMQIFEVSPDGSLLYVLVVQHSKTVLQIIDIQETAQLQDEPKTIEDLHLKTVHFAPPIDPLDLTGFKLLINPTGSHIALYTPKLCHVLHLPMPSHMYLPNKSFLCPITQLASSNIIQVQWHSMSPLHLCILETDTFVLYDLGDPEKLIEETLDSESSVAFCLGSNYGWNAFSVFLMGENGELRLVCPLVPQRCCITESHYKQLLIGSRAYARTNRGMFDVFMSQFERQYREDQFVYTFKRSACKGPNTQSIECDTLKGSKCVSLFTTNTYQPTFPIYALQSNGMLSLFICSFPIQPEFRRISSRSSLPAGTNKLIKAHSAQLDPFQAENSILLRQSLKFALFSTLSHVFAVHLVGHDGLMEVCRDDDITLLSNELKGEWVCEPMRVKSKGLDACFGLVVSSAFGSIDAILSIDKNLKLLCCENAFDQLSFKVSSLISHTVELVHPNDVVRNIPKDVVESSVPLIDTEEHFKVLNVLRESLEKIGSEKAIQKWLEQFQNFIKDVSDTFHTVNSSVKEGVIASEMIEDLDHRIHIISRRIHRIEQAVVQGGHSEDIRLARAVEEKLLELEGTKILVHEVCPSMFSYL